MQERMEIKMSFDNKALGQGQAGGDGRKSTYD